jgi:ribosomal protein L9
MLFSSLLRDYATTYGKYRKSDIQTLKTTIGRVSCKTHRPEEKQQQRWEEERQQREREEEEEEEEQRNCYTSFKFSLLVFASSNGNKGKIF